MRLKTWLVAALGLGSLVGLIALPMLASSRKAQDIYTQLDQPSKAGARQMPDRSVAIASAAHDIDVLTTTESTT